MPHLSQYEVFTVNWMGWSGIKNGKLMELCTANGFDVLLTIDKNLMYKQNLDKYPVTIAVLNSQTSKVEELVTFLPSFKQHAASFEKYKAYVIDK